jgi:hypothetical protein
MKHFGRPKLPEIAESRAWKSSPALSTESAQHDTAAPDSAAAKA